MEAELRLTDPLLKPDVGDVLDLGVSRRESKIFESSRPSLFRVGLVSSWFFLVDMSVTFYHSVDNLSNQRNCIPVYNGTMYI